MAAKQSVSQSMQRVLRTQELLQELRAQLEREFYADPDKYGPRLPRRIRHMAYLAARQRRQEIINELLAEITTT